MAGEVQFIDNTSVAYLLYSFLLTPRGEFDLYGTFAFRWNFAGSF